jgi:hypothetical protein
MLASRRARLLSVVLLLGGCLFVFQNFDDAFDPETQNETLDNMQVEDEVLQTSTDDIRAQQREARENARLAAQERAKAEAKLEKTRARREQVEGEAKVKISKDVARRQKAIESRDRLNIENTRLEKEIAAIEQRMEKSHREAEVARAQAKKSRARYLQLKQKKAELIQSAKAASRTTGLRFRRPAKRSLASVSGNDGRGLPRVLPPKRIAEGQ